MQNQNFARVTALALGIAGVLAFGQAQASGFQIKENSTKALGRAFAGSGAASGDASVVSNNPAAMSTFKQNVVQADVAVIDLTADFTGGGQAAAGTPLARPLTGGDGGDPGDATPVPSLAAIFPIGDTGMTLGAQVSAPFGLKTEYDRDWVGRYNAVESDVKTVDLTLAASFDFGSEVSFGVGLIYQRAEATLSNALDLGSAICRASPAACLTPGTPFGPQRNDGFSEVTGDDTGIGWIIGMHIHPNERTSIGFSHRSEIDHTLEGNIDFTVPANVATVLGPNAPADSIGGADLTTPAVDTISVSYGVTDNFTVLADFSRTQWSSMKNVTIVAGPNNRVLTVEDFDWKDTTFASIGAEWQLNEAFTLRAGYAQDQTPTKIETRTPRLPDADRQWASVGVSWQASEAFEVNAAYTRILVDDPEISGIHSTSGSTLTGKFDADVNIFAVSAQYKF